MSMSIVSTSFHVQTIQVPAASLDPVSRMAAVTDQCQDLTMEDINTLVQSNKILKCYDTILKAPVTRGSCMARIVEDNCCVWLERAIIIERDWPVQGNS